MNENNGILAFSRMKHPQGVMVEHGNAERLACHGSIEPP